MVLFKDINKSASDCITRDFPHDKPWEVEVKSGNGQFAFTHQASVSGKEAAGVDSNSTLRFSEKELTVESKFFNSGAAFVDAKWLKKNVGNGDLVVNTRVDKKGDSYVPEVSLDYCSKTAHAKGSVNPVALTWNGSCLFSVNAAKVGGEISGSKDLSKLSYALGASYTHQNMTGSVKTASAGGSAFGKLVGNVHFKKEATEVGAEVSHALTGGSKTSLSLAGKYAINKESALKARINGDGHTAIAFTHIFSPLLTSTFGVQCDSVDAKSLKYGVKLNIAA